MKRSQRTYKRTLQRKNKRSNKRTHKNKRHTYKGGDNTLVAHPFNSFGFTNGAGSPREDALLHEKNNNALQHKLNRQSGGKRARRSSTARRSSRTRRSSRAIRSSRTRRSSTARRSSRTKQRGGTIEVPTFPPIGGIPQAYSTTDLSIGGNTNLVKGINDAQGDCFATDTCPPAPTTPAPTTPAPTTPAPASATAGGARRRRRTHK